MIFAIVIFLLTTGTVAFHFWSPWYLTELASNWSGMDDALTITFVITGVVFVLINVFMAYAVFKYRHKEGSRADYEPENTKLELWLTGLTAVGVVALLAPGLIVWAEFVDVPEDAMVVEAVGQQWTWTFRYPGDDGILGAADPSFMTIDNPFGMNPGDPYGQDDIVVEDNEGHLPTGGPVKMVLRSKDVLHDFYVPQIRSKMDLVPGVETYFWFEPTRVGEFEILCAELCGTGHYTMRGLLVVQEKADFDIWLSEQPTFGELSAEAVAESNTELSAELSTEVSTEVSAEVSTELSNE
jgi:cytochrome c oxidase subunit 2